MKTKNYSPETVLSNMNTKGKNNTLTIIYYGDIYQSNSEPSPPIYFRDYWIVFQIWNLNKKLFYT